MNLLALFLFGVAATTGSVVNLPGLTIRGGTNQCVEATGKVCLTDGILDFAAVEVGGREYESVFALDAKPSALQFALLLVGCETNRSELAIEVTWQDAGKARRAPLGELLVDRRTKKPVGNAVWFFAGSGFVMDPVAEKEVFAADAEMAHIAVVKTSLIPVTLRGEFGNPYQGSDQGFEVNAARIPPKGTPVTLVFRRR